METAAAPTTIKEQVASEILAVMKWQGFKVKDGVGFAGAPFLIAIRDGIEHMVYGEPGQEPWELASELANKIARWHPRRRYEQLMLLPDPGAE